MNRLFIAIDLSTCKFYREFKNSYVYVWIYYFHLISSVLMMTYYFVCALSKHESILKMCLYLWEKVRLVENGLQDIHNVCSAGVEVPKYRSSNGDDLQFTPKCVVHNKNGSPLYNTMFILFDIHILWFQNFRICCDYERTNKHCQSTHAITFGDY